MARVIKEVQKLDQVKEQQPQQPQVESTQQENQFEVEYDSDEGTASFELSDGTPVTLKSPRAKQFLLVESWMKTRSEDYQSDTFACLKMAQVCIAQYGNQTKVSFDNLLDQLEMEDIERLAKALECFQPAFDKLKK